VTILLLRRMRLIVKNEKEEKKNEREREIENVRTNPMIVVIRRRMTDVAVEGAKKSAPERRIERNPVGKMGTKGSINHQRDSGTTKDILHKRR
jgi:hypothetical protein